MTIIELEDVSKVYKIGEVETQALDDVDLTIEEGSSQPLSVHLAPGRQPCCS